MHWATVQHVGWVNTLIPQVLRQKALVLTVLRANMAHTLLRRTTLILGPHTPASIAKTVAQESGVIRQGQAQVTLVQIVLWVDTRGKVV